MDIDFLLYISQRCMVVSTLCMKVFLLSMPSVVKGTTYTFTRVILSSVVWNTKFVSKVYKKTLISISEKRMPIHDCSEKHK